VERAFRSDWVTRFGGEIVNPFPSWNFGVPPVSKFNHKIYLPTRNRMSYAPTVNNRIPTLTQPSPLAASSQAFVTSSLFNASPLINLAFPLLTYFWMMAFLSNTAGPERRRNVTVAPFSVQEGVSVQGDNGNEHKNAMEQHR